MSTDADPATALSDAPFDWMAHPRKVNVGCGWDRREGYVNVDLHAFHEPDLLADVRDLRQLPTGEYDEVLARDVLEHLPRADAPVALAEWARLLRIDGTLVLRVPDLVGLLRQFELSTDPAQHAVLVQCLYGTQAYDGDWHSNGYTELLLRIALHDAGFDVVSIAHFDEWLFDVVARRTDQPRPVSAADLVFAGTPADPAPVADSEHRADVDGDAALDAALARLAATRLSTAPQPASSRLPGGGLFHRIVIRATGRHLTALAAQTNAALDAVSDAVSKVAEDNRRRR